MFHANASSWILIIYLFGNYRFFNPCHYWDNLNWRILAMTNIPYSWWINTTEIKIFTWNPSPTLIMEITSVFVHGRPCNEFHWISLFWNLKIFTELTSNHSWQLVHLKIVAVLRSWSGIIITVSKLRLAVCEKPRDSRCEIRDQRSTHVVWESARVRFDALIEVGCEPPGEGVRRPLYNRRPHHTTFFSNHDIFALREQIGNRRLLTWREHGRQGHRSGGEAHAAVHDLHEERTHLFLEPEIGPFSNYE